MSGSSGRVRRAAAWLDTRIAERLSPERTRRATLLERVTVERLSWSMVVRIHRWLELLGKLATTVWVLFVAARSAIGFARWRLQRELWRRDVARMEE